MKCPDAKARKTYDSIRYRGEPVEVHYSYDAESNRWCATSPNVPLLITENDSIEEIERDLPDIMELIIDADRTLGPTVRSDSRGPDERWDSASTGERGDRERPDRAGFGQGAVMSAGSPGTYRVKRDVLPLECPWLEEPVGAGTVVYRWTGPTYGCIGANGVAVTVALEVAPFFELPAEVLEEVR